MCYTTTMQEHNPLNNKRNIDPVGDSLFNKYEKIQEDLKKELFDLSGEQKSDTDTDQKDSSPN